MMKDEAHGTLVKEFVGQRSTSYSVKIDNDINIKKR